MRGYSSSGLVRGALPYVQQTAWAVDSVNGDDRAAGTPGDPILTLGELSRRWCARTWEPLIPAVTVALAGTFPNEPLILSPNFPGNAAAFPVVTLTGQMTLLVAATAITAYTPEAAPVRASLTAGAIDFAALLAANGQVRLRVTTGAAAGAVAWVQSTTGLGQANISQFTIAPSTVVNPAVADSIVVEVPSTIINRAELVPTGPVSITLRDATLGGANFPSSFLGGASRFFGCKIGTSLALNTFLRGLLGSALSPPGIVACATWSMLDAAGPLLISSHAAWSTVFLSRGYHTINRMQFDGAGGGAANLTVHNGGVVEYISAPISIFGSAGAGGRVVLVEDGGQLIGSSAAAAFYGTNTAALSAAIRNGGQWNAITLPALISAGAPNELSLAGAAAVPWAFAAAAAPGNAVLNARA